MARKKSAGESNQSKNSLWYVITHQRDLDRKEYLKLINRVITFVALAFFGSILVFAAIVWFGGGGSVINVILASNLHLYLFAFVAVLASLLLRFVKWSYYIHKFGLKISKLKSLAIYLSMYSMDLTPGNLGRVVSAYTLSKVTSARTVEVTPIVVMDIFTDSLGFALLTFIAAFYYNVLTIPVLIADIVLLLPVFMFLVSPWFYDVMKGFIMNHKFWRRFSIYGDEYFASQSRLNKWDVYLVSVLVGIPASFLQACTFYIALTAILGTAPPLGHTIFVSSTSQLFGMVSTIPGNLGITDATLVAFSQQVLGITSQDASAATIMMRLATLWFSVIVGGIFLFLTLKYWKRQGPKKAPLTMANIKKKALEKVGR